MQSSTSSKKNEQNNSDQDLQDSSGIPYYPLQSRVIQINVNGKEKSTNKQGLFFFKREVAWVDLAAISKNYFTAKRQHEKRGKGDHQDWEFLVDQAKKRYVSLFQSMNFVLSTFITELMKIGVLNETASNRKKRAFQYVQNYMKDSLVKLQPPLDSIAVKLICDEIKKLISDDDVLEIKGGQRGILSYLAERSNGKCSYSSKGYKNFIRTFQSKIKHLQKHESKIAKHSLLNHFQSMSSPVYECTDHDQCAHTSLEFSMGIC